MASTADFKNGLVLKEEGQLWQITEFQHVKPGKGPAFVRTKLKNVVTGKTVDKTLTAGVKVETATVDRRDMTVLYRDGEDYVLMDEQDFDQINVSPDVMGEGARFLLENTSVQVSMHEGLPLFAEMPVAVDLVVKHTDPGLKGERSTSGTKQINLEIGAELEFPMFMI